jgi:hypothetical protein
MGLFDWIGDRADDLRDAARASGKALFAAAGASAYVGLAGIIKQRNDDLPAHKLSDLALPDRVAKYLEAAFPDVYADARVRFGAALVEPLRVMGHTIGTNPAAQTFGLNIYVQAARRDGTDSGQLELLAHELTHSKQYDRRGRSLYQFGFDYFGEFFDADFKYAKNDMEQEADRVAACFVSRALSEIRSNRLGDVRTWRKSWSTFTPFYASGRPHYLAYRKDERRVHLTRIKDAHASTDVLLDKVLPSPTLTAFVPLVLGGQPHFLAYNEDSGKVRLLRVGTSAADALTLEELWTDDWKASWMFMPFVLDGVQHYLAYHRDSGAAHLTKLGADGRGQRMYDGDWSTGWTSFHPFQVDGQPHFLAYKRGSGKVHLSRINPNAGGLTKLKEGDWTGGWTDLIPLSQNGRRFMMYKGPVALGSSQLAGTGAVQVRDIDLDGRGTSEIWCDDWRGSISSLAGYVLDGEPHVLRYERDNGEARFYAFNQV